METKDKIVNLEDLKVVSDYHKTALTDAISGIQSLVGSPLVATAKSEMTNTDKVYVYQRSPAESGMVNGNWYYYDGSAWQSGGVYNAVAIDTDKTLTVEDQAADSKAVGDELRMFDNRLEGTAVQKTIDAVTGESHLGCIRSYDTSTGEINGYTPAESSAWFAEINKLSYASVYGNLLTSRIEITDNVSRIYTTSRVQQVISSTHFAFVIADKNGKWIASVSQASVMNGTTPTSAAGFMQNNNGIVSFDVAAIRAAYKNAKYIYVTTAATAQTSGFVQWYVDVQYDFLSGITNAKDGFTMLSGVPQTVQVEGKSVETHLGCIRGYDASDNTLNGYTPTADSLWFAEVNRTNYASTYGNLRIHKILIDGNLNRIYTTESVMPIVSQSVHGFVIATEAGRYIASITYDSMVSGNVPEAYSEFMQNDSGVVSFDVWKIKAKYPAAKFIYVTVAADNTSENYVDWNIDIQYEFMQKIESLESREDTTNVQIVLPKTLYAVSGNEFVMYYDNFVLCDNIKNYAVYVSPSITNGMNLDRCFRLTPTAAQAGSYTCSVNVVDRVAGQTVASKNFTLSIVENSRVSGKKIMFIGDSLTNAGIYPAEIQYNLSGGGMVSVGTRQTTVTVSGTSRTVNHEGRSGWSINNYCTAQSVGGISNPFYNPTSQKFDFSYYMTNNSSISKPDIVCINLGTNNVGNYNSEITQLKQMVDSIHLYDANIIVLVSLIAPGAHQDGFGMLSLGTTADSFKRSALARDKVYISNYDDKVDKVGVSAPLVFLDTDYDFPTTSVSVSARNNTTVVIQNNNVHPAEPGYLHFADAYYNTILHWLLA